jgi:hypothetical protein
MIRIDEIYNNTFWPWFKANMPLTRCFFCDPPGDSSPEALKNFGDDATELHYIFFHDQEPIHLAQHRPLFEDVVRRNLDLNHDQGAILQGIVCSEKDSDAVDEICALYQWRPYYYFFHGWAALDWFRGYDKSFLMSPPDQRNISHSLIAPNRIIGGQRDHRVLLMYHLLKKQIRKAHISFPTVCPVESVPVAQIASKWQHRYPDIQNVFLQADLPMHMPGETGHPMHSCWLSLFDQCAESLVYVVTETAYFGRRNHITEKTFKPICLQMPWILAAPAGSLAYMRSYGFKTFGDFWDESYDEETDDIKRIEKLARLLHDLDQLSQAELQQLHRHVRPAVDHNFRHFYGQDFCAILWQELQAMLAQLSADHSVVHACTGL